MRCALHFALYLACCLVAAVSVVTPAAYTTFCVTAAAAPASSGASQPNPRSPAVRAVFLRDEADQPSPRRGVRDVRGSYPREQYLITKTAAAADSYARWVTVTRCVTIGKRCGTLGDNGENIPEKTERFGT